MENLPVLILDLLTEASEEGLSLSELVDLTATFWQKVLFGQLLAQWRQGRILASTVERQEFGYTPTKDAKWTLSEVEGYFGYDAATGLYQLRAGNERQLRLHLLATLHLDSPVYSIAVSPNGDDFVVGLYSGEIAFGSLGLGSIHKRIAAHLKRVWSLDFSPAGEVFVSGSQDGRIIIWDRHGKSRNIIAELEDWITCVRFSPNGNHILSGHKLANSENPSVRMWDVASSKQVESYFHHKKNVYGVGFLPNGRGFVSGGSDNNVAYWSFETQQLVFQSDKHTGTVTNVTIHPHLNNVVSGAWTGTLKVWDLESGEVLQTIEAHNSRVTSLGYSRSGRFLASGGRDSMVAVWLMPESTLLASTRAHEGWVRAVAFGEDDHLLVSGGSEGNCKIWKLVPLVGREENTIL
jgi:WD40 repeat protein